MTITAITIENFKGIKEPVRVEFKPITLLFGPNSAGKSTIIHALHYAREIFERQNLSPDTTIIGGNSINLGGFENMVYNHDKRLSINIGFELDLSNTSLPNYLESEIDGYTYNDPERFEKIESDLQASLANITSASVKVTVSWSKILERPFISTYSIYINNKSFSSIESSADGRQIYISSFNPFNSAFIGNMSGDEFINILEKKLDSKELSDMENEKWDNASPFFFISCNLFLGEKSLNETTHISIENLNSALPRWGRSLSIKYSDLKQDQEIEYEHLAFYEQVLSSLMVGPGELALDSLKKLSYLGPLRKVPSRNYEPNLSPDESRWANGVAAWDTCYNADDAFIGKINDWLTNEHKLNSGYSIEVKKYRELEAHDPLAVAVLQERILDENINMRARLLALPVKRRLLIWDEARNIELAPQDIGVGISQVLPVIVAALHRKTGLVLIEQPELHIHPAFQVALGDLFIEQAREHTDLTFILETHSEHLMLRFLRRIRETGEQEVPDKRSLTPNDLSIYFIEQGKEGISCLPIRVDEEGDFIDHWPHGFFHERSEELF